MVGGESSREVAKRGMKVLEEATEGTAGYKTQTKVHERRLTYWKSVRQAFDEMMIQDILSLQNGRSKEFY